MSTKITDPGAMPARNADKQGLKRVMTLGGAYATRNYTIKHLRELKGVRVLTETMPFTTDEAAAAEEAGIDTLKVRFDPDNPASSISIRQAAPNTFMTFTLGLTKYFTEADAIQAGYAAMDAGADGIMCQWRPSMIRAVADAGIPVEAHAGLVPRLSTWTGGLKAVGKTLDEAVTVFQAIKAYENAGAWAVEVEVIPAQLLAEISVRTSLVTSSIGAGSGGDIQFLFAEDILGNNPGPHPRHTKQYRNLFKMQQALQAERVAGFRDYIDDVQAEKFPGPEHIVNAPEGLIEGFLKAIEN